MVMSSVLIVSVNDEILALRPTIVPVADCKSPCKDVMEALADAKSPLRDVIDLFPVAIVDDVWKYV